jgi:hypothetical protein
MAEMHCHTGRWVTGGPDLFYSVKADAYITELRTSVAKKD